MPIARPTSDPAFATNATYSADADPWAGDPTRADPGAPRRAEGFEPDTLPAEWLNWEIGVQGDWAKWFGAILDSNEEHTYQTTKTRDPVIPGCEIRNGLTTGAWKCDEGGGALCTTNLAFANLALNLYLRPGQVLHAINIFGGSYNTATTYGVRFRLFKRVGALGSPVQIGPTVYSPTAAGAWSPTITISSPETVAVGTVYWLEIDSSDNAAGGGTGDRITYVAPHLDDMGPRNPF